MGGLRWMRLGTRKMGELWRADDGESVDACAIESRVDQSVLQRSGKLREECRKAA